MNVADYTNDPLCKLIPQLSQYVSSIDSIAYHPPKD